MGSIRKRGKTYTAEVRRKGFYAAETFRTREGAKQWIAKLETELYAGTAKTLNGSHTLQDAFNRYEKDEAPKKGGARWEIVRVKKFAVDLKDCVDLPIVDIGPAHIAEWRNSRLKVVSGESVRREWNLLHRIFKLAIKEWEWIKANPMDGVERPPKGKPRKRRLLPGELERIYKAANITPTSEITTNEQRAALAFELGVESAMRAGEMRSLTEDQIDLATGVAHLNKTKNGDERDVPLSKRARALIARLLQSTAHLPGGDDPREHRLLPMTDSSLDATWRKLRSRAKITGLTFHDSRAEATTRMAKKVDILTLSRITGHRDLKMLQVYYRESPEDIAKRLG